MAKEEQCTGFDLRASTRIIAESRQVWECWNVGARAAAAGRGHLTFCDAGIRTSVGAR
jgi:hypothetical protein